MENKITMDKRIVWNWQGKNVMIRKTEGDSKVI